MVSDRDPKRRFGDRVADYVKYRPHYPAAMVDWMHARGVAADHVVADLGAGTGILTDLLLAAGHRVYAIEPNPAMRAAAEAQLAHRPGFTSVDASAEATTLPSSSVDLVTAGQAFHWFDVDATRAECLRILRPGGHAGLVWNDRLPQASPAMAAYEQLLADWGTDYRQTTFRFQGLDDKLARFFGGPYEIAEFANAQRLDEAGLLGRFFSSSYTPARDDRRYEAAADAARAMFHGHQHDGAVELLYQTRLFFGAVVAGD